MKLYAAISGLKAVTDKLVEMKVHTYYNLYSYYYLTKGGMDSYLNNGLIQDMVLIDSGAHSFQLGTKVNYDEFTKEYAKFIKKHDNDTVQGYFEMDVDNILGYQKVLELREVLEDASDKIIPVWHRNRGIEDFKQMCQNYDYVSVSGFVKEDIKDKDFIHFVKYAHKQGCRIHGLGLTRQKIISKVPFDSVDSSSWAIQVAYAHLDGRKIKSEFASQKGMSTKIQLLAYYQFMKRQEEYDLKFH